MVVHDSTGVSHDPRAQVDWLAGEGLLTVAPDLYHWGSRLGCLRTIHTGHRRPAGADVRRHRGRPCSARRGRPVHRRSASSGSAWAAGTPSRWRRTAVTRPRPSTTADAPPTPKRGWPEPARSSAASAARAGPLGAKAGRRLDDLLTRLGVPHNVKIYPGAGHGFMNDHAPADLTLMLRVLGRLPGTRYDQAATADARRRIVTFFRDHLR
nr:dienelactone hydrolase family protein [Amycolatopsis methanolica]